MLYVGIEALGEHLIGPAVDEPDVLDASLVRGFRALHRALGDPGDVFEAESIFALVAERLGRHLGERRRDEGLPGGSVVEELRDLLDARLFVGITLAEAGRILEVSPAHLVRSFTSRFGISPHRYLVGRRIEVARRRLLEGDPLARVAVDVGFHDQAHFTRHFKRHVGTTPGRFRARAGCGKSASRWPSSQPRSSSSARSSSSSSSTSDPSSYANDWGGPSLAGVLLVHCEPGVLAAIALATWWRRARSSRAHEPAR